MEINIAVRPVPHPKPALVLVLQDGIAPDPASRPQYNGSIENFNERFHRLFQCYSSQMSALKRELQLLQETVTLSKPNG